MTVATATGAPLSARQEAMLNAIRTYITEHGGRSPTVRELTVLTGKRSTGDIHYHLAVLQRSGFITRDFAQARSIRLTGAVRGTCPHCGQELAG